LHRSISLSASLYYRPISSSHSTCLPACLPYVTHNTTAAQRNLPGPDNYLISNVRCCYDSLHRRRRRYAYLLVVRVRVGWCARALARQP